MTKWVCPFFLNTSYFPPTTQHRSCAGTSRVARLWREGKQCGKAVMEWGLSNCASPSPRIPQRQRGCQQGEDGEKGERTWALPWPTIPARAALLSLVLPARYQVPCKIFIT